MKFKALLLPFAFCLFTSCAPSPPGSPVIQIRAATGAQPAHIEITGLSDSELSDVRGARLSADAWAALLLVTVDNPTLGLPPVQGRYAVTGSAITFTPLFPFDEGRAYRVSFEPARLPRRSPKTTVSAVVRLPAAVSQPSTEVTAVYPLGDTLPENTLRLYIEFSAPMGNAGALDFVRIVDERGELVDIPFLPVQADFWNADHTRYTLFFDPGRVKQGILPNEQLGRPLGAGRKYSLEIAALWRDARGQPLKAAYRREFRVGPALSQAIALDAWRIESPAARTRDPLVVTFPWPLDHGLLARAIGVEGSGGRMVAGDIGLEAADTRWVFRPVDAWEPGAYQLVALSILEDPAGNRIGRPFEIDMTKSTASETPDVFRRRFIIGVSGS